MKNRTSRTSAIRKVATAVALLAVASASFAWPTYSVADVSNLPPDPTYTATAKGVNGLGHVLVFIDSIGPGYAYAVCTAASCTLLGPPISGDWTANALDKFDHVAGSVYTGSDIAFVGNNVIGYDRANCPGCGFGKNSESAGINQYGDAAGKAEFGQAGQQAFRYTSSAGMVSLGTLGGTNSEARDINKWGDVAGSSQMPGDTHTHAFIYSGSTMTDLGLLSGQDAWAYALNNQRTVVGCATDPGILRAFIRYNVTPMQGLPHLNAGPSCAVAVNGSDTAVGYSSTNAGRRAVIWRNGQIKNLNNLLNSTGAGWTLIEATGINAAGQIVGNGIHNGLTRPFLLY